MTKKDLIDRVYHSNDHLPRTLIANAVNLFFESLRLSLSHHQRVELRGFGVFCLRHRKAHKAHNPKTGQKLLVKEKIVPFFKASQALKNRLKKRPLGKNPKVHISLFFPFFVNSSNLNQ